MSIKKIIALFITALMVLALAACTAQNGGNDMKDGPKSLEEAAKMYNELMQQENDILSKNTDLWEKVFASADKGMIMQEDGKNYGDFLLATIESAKDKFSDKEYKMLKDGGEKIREIENELKKLESKYPDVAQAAMGGGNNMSVPANGSMDITAGGNINMPAEKSNVNKFPSFVGKDLDGNDVKSDDIFSANAVTVVNFWFTTCGPCVGELSELDALNKELAEKGGKLIGVNSFTLDGNQTAISEAKEVLAKKGASYQNVYFDSDSEAGKFTTNIFAYPATYVVDRNGNIVGDPIVGAITEKKQGETLSKLIEQTIAADKG